MQKRVPWTTKCRRSETLGRNARLGDGMVIEQELLLAEGIRDLRMIHLPSSSHAILTLEPEACAQHVLRFVMAHDAAEREGT